MARPAADYKVLNSNRSSYNLIAHEQYVPPSPPFAPSPRHTRVDPERDYEAPGGGDGRNEDKREQYGRVQWNNVQERESPRQPEPNPPSRDYFSLDNLIQHRHHIPDSPLYRPGQGRDQGQGQSRAQFDVGDEERQRGYARNRDDQNDLPYPPSISHLNHIPVSPLYRPDITPVVDADPRSGRVPGCREFELWQNRKGLAHMADGVGATRKYQTTKGYGPLADTIGHINHVPVSPLYRPGLGRGLSMADPRYGSPQGRRQFGIKEVQRPKDPPTPDYNTTRLHIPDTNNEDTNLDLTGLRGSQEDLRGVNKSTNMPWARYEERHAPYTDRSGHGGHRSYRDNPWTSRERTPGFIADPRFGGQYEGIASTGSRNGGVLLFIRFPVGQGENVNVAAQAFLKSKTHDNGGRFLGMAKKVYDFGYEKGPMEGMGVFHFPSMEKADIFFQMDPIIRQPDFPAPGGHAEIWAINNAYLPDNMQLFNTFLLSETELHSGKDLRDFFEAFQKPFESYLYNNGGMPFVICSFTASDRKSLRRHSYSSTSIVTCHLFQGLDHLNWITNDETYSKFRSLHNQMATEKCSIFTLSTQIFP